ncbi:hypothetical protein BMF94_6523 [Rhodotorula taiwanensis]|uniref:Uncharacterized protein n=1 Tax=Rhodotorula taiwanensis TaxID=741276 RepID=A0A2S5B134_9BASI|nr:hypothetical protein BMF94_6523 [Rhodotorula taiwanensis]
MSTPETLHRPIADPFDELVGRTRAPVDPTVEVEGPPPPPAVIRPFNPKTDLKLVRYLIGAVVMEPSSLANQAALFKPVSLALWLGITHLLITRFTNGYPAFVHNRLYPDQPRVSNMGSQPVSPIWEIITLLPVVVAPVIAILAVFEWRHRNLFEAEMRRAIGEEDMRDIQTYYGVDNQGGAHEVGKATTGTPEQDAKNAPKQRHGFWVLEFDNRMLGAVGLDGRKPGQPLDSVADQIEAGADKKLEGATASFGEDKAASTATSIEGDKSTLKVRGKAAPSVSVAPPSPSSGDAQQTFSLDSTSPLPAGTLHLRRFGTSLSFRPAGIDDDLLVHVAKVAFSPSVSPDQPEPAQQLVFSIRSTIQKSLRQALERNGWELVPRGSELELASSSAAVKANTSVVDPIWPLNLSERTMVLRRSRWEQSQGKQ